MPYVRPDVHAVLNMLGNAPGPQMHEVDAPTARAMMRQMTLITERPRGELARVLDLGIPSPHGHAIPARLYSAVATPADGPVVAFYHGGGWVIGDLDSHDAMCRALANESSVRVVAVDYRLAPENKFPAAFEDAYAALVWTEKNATEQSFNPNRIAVAGDSAGGNLAAAVALHTKAKGGPKLSAQILLYPVTQAKAQTGSMNELAKGYFLEKAGMDWFCDQYMEAGTDPADPRLSPLSAKDVGGVAPAFIVVAEYDPLKDEGKQYAAKLKAAGVDTTLIEVKGMIHGYLAMGGLLPQANLSLKEIGQAIAKLLA